ncbi:MAG TPA: GIY-YIG nuclease family protein [Flavobacteriaceae bacterium]|nr:GIY-YIG nuclease family protein [Flavobacteriaceae bacterium]
MGLFWFLSKVEEYVVYILASSKTQKLYKGFTCDLINRLKSHNKLSRKGWTVHFRPWKVIFVRFFSIKKEALEFEKYLKSGVGREWIKKNVDVDQ